MKIARRSVCMVMVLTSSMALCACNLVLGIDDVSSANGPDSGQRAFGATAEPAPDAGAPASDAGTAGQADAAAPNSESSPQGSAGRVGAPASDRDAAAVDAATVVAPPSPDAALDEDAGESGDDAGALR